MRPSESAEFPSEPAPAERRRGTPLIAGDQFRSRTRPRDEADPPGPVVPEPPLNKSLASDDPSSVGRDDDRHGNRLSDRLGLRHGRIQAEAASGVWLVAVVVSMTVFRTVRVARTVCRGALLDHCLRLRDRRCGA